MLSTFFMKDTLDFSPGTESKAVRQQPGMTDSKQLSDVTAHNDNVVEISAATQTFSCGTTGQELSLHLLSLLNCSGQRKAAIFRSTSLTLLLLVGSQLIASEQSYISVDVIPLTESVVPGEAFDIAVIFSMAEDWHTYWQNPGEAGMPSSFEWTLPDNFTIIMRQDPTPRRHMEEGITTFIHEEEAIYLFSIEAPDDVADTNDFAVDIQWLECKSLCRPGSSQQHFTLEKGTSPTPAKEKWESLLARAEKHFPLIDLELSGTLVKKVDHFELSLKPASRTNKLQRADFFPFDEMVYDSGKPIQIKHGFRRDKIIIPLLKETVTYPKALHGVLVQIHQTPLGLITTNSIINQPLQ